LNDGSLVQLGQGRNRKLIMAALTSATSHIAVEAACNKELAKRLLREAFLPVPDGRVVSSADEAVAVLEALATPVVVKPLYGNQGKGVSLNLTDRDQVRHAFGVAAAVSFLVLVEEQVAGSDYRVADHRGQSDGCESSRSLPSGGDGQHTVSELIETRTRIRGAERVTASR
jgi:cyanophycin synthetase